MLCISFLVIATIVSSSFFIYYGEINTSITVFQYIKIDGHDYNEPIQHVIEEATFGDCFCFEHVITNEGDDYVILDWQHTVPDNITITVYQSFPCYISPGDELSISMCYTIGMIPSGKYTVESYLKPIGTLMQYSINASNDSYICQYPSDQDENHGNEDNMHVRSYEVVWREGEMERYMEMRSIVGFDIPVGGVYSAIIRLYYYDWGQVNPVDRTLRAYGITDEWDEYTVTWNDQPSTNFSPTNHDVVPDQTEVWMEWDVTSDVQQGISSWMIKDARWLGGGANPPRASFRTKEYGDFIPQMIFLSV